MLRFPAWFDDPKRLAIPAIVCAGLALASFVPVRAQTFPGLRLRGTLSDAAGTPVSGSLAVTVRIYPVETGGTALYAESFTTMVSAGALDLTLGIGAGTATGDLVTALAPSGPGPLDRYLTLIIEGDSVELTPRRRLTAGAYSGYASFSANAASLGGVSAAGYALLAPTAPQTFTGSQAFSGSVDFTQTPAFSGPVPFSVSSTTRIVNLNASFAGQSDLALGSLGTLGAFGGQTFSQGCSYSPAGMDCSRCQTCAVQSAVSYPATNWMKLALVDLRGGPGTLVVDVAPLPIGCTGTSAASSEIRLQSASTLGTFGTPDDAHNFPMATEGHYSGDVFPPASPYHPINGTAVTGRIDTRHLPPDFYYAFIKAIVTSPPASPCFFVKTGVTATFVPYGSLTTVGIDP